MMMNQEKPNDKMDVNLCEIVLLNKVYIEIIKLQLRFSILKAFSNLQNLYNHTKSKIMVQMKRLLKQILK